MVGGTGTNRTRYSKRNAVDMPFKSLECIIIKDQARFVMDFESFSSYSLCISLSLCYKNIRKPQIMEIPLHFLTTTVYWLPNQGLLGLISAQYINLG